MSAVLSSLFFYLLFIEKQLHTFCASRNARWVEGRAELSRVCFFCESDAKLPTFGGHDGAWILMEGDFRSCVPDGMRHTVNN